MPPADGLPPPVKFHFVKFFTASVLFHPSHNWYTFATQLKRKDQYMELIGLFDPICTRYGGYFLGCPTIRREGKAQVAVGRIFLRIAYFLILRQEEYHEVGPTYLDQLDARGLLACLVKRLQVLGFRVDVQTKCGV